MASPTLSGHVSILIRAYLNYGRFRRKGKILAPIGFSKGQKENSTSKCYVYSFERVEEKERRERNKNFPPSSSSHSLHKDFSSFLSKCSRYALSGWLPDQLKVSSTILRRNCLHLTLKD